MTPNEQGKFCGQCSLTVVDFTKMNEAEIKEYFLCHYGQKTCGRFKASQLNNLPSKIETRLRQSYIKAAVLSILALLALLTGCRKPVSNTPPYHLMGDVDIETMGEPKFNIEQVDSIKTDSTIELIIDPKKNPAPQNPADKK